MSESKKNSKQERIAGIKQFAAKNWLFLIIAAILCLYLLGETVPQKRATNSTESTAATEVTEQVEEEEAHWRFYPIDLWVLLIGGGFCTIMILKEKKKARETLK